MKKSFIIIFLSLMCTMACVKKEESLTIEKERLILIIADLHFAEASLENLDSLKSDSLQKLYNQQISKIHGVSQEEIRKNLDLLKQNPKNMFEYVRAASDSLRVWESKQKNK